MLRPLNSGLSDGDGPGESTWHSDYVVWGKGGKWEGGFRGRTTDCGLKVPIGDELMYKGARKHKNIRFNLP
jgi:hypothetical protein